MNAQTLSRMFLVRRRRVTPPGPVQEAALQAFQKCAEAVNALLLLACVVALAGARLGVRGLEKAHREMEEAAVWVVPGRGAGGDL